MGSPIERLQWRGGSKIELCVPTLFRGGKEGEKPEKEDEKVSLLKGKKRTGVCSIWEPWENFRRGGSEKLCQMNLEEICFSEVEKGEPNCIAL